MKSVSFIKKDDFMEILTSLGAMRSPETTEFLVFNGGFCAGGARDAPFSRKSWICDLGNFGDLL